MNQSGMRRHRVLALTMSLALAGGVAPQAMAQDAEGTQDEPLRFTLLVGNAGNEFWALTWAGMMDAIEGFGLPVEVEGPLGPPEWNGEMQLAAMDQVIASSPDAIIITANDSQILVPGVEAAVEEGIVVQAFDVAPNTPLASFVGTSFVEMGEIMGERVLELCADDIAEIGECKVGITEMAGQEFTEQRLSGFRSVVEGHPEIVIAGECDDKNNPELTVTCATQMLAADPDIRVLMSFHGQGAVALASAVRSSGAVPGEDVYVIGNDLGTTTLDCIEVGDCDGTVTQDPYTMGVYAVVNAYLQVADVMDRTMFEGKDAVPLINSGTGYLQRDELPFLKQRVEELQDAFASRG